MRLAIEHPEADAAKAAAAMAIASLGLVLCLRLVGVAPAVDMVTKTDTVTALNQDRMVAAMTAAVESVGDSDWAKACVFMAEVTWSKSGRHCLGSGAQFCSLFRESSDYILK